MFTGIIEEIGIIKKIDKNSSGAKVFIESNFFDLKMGESVCVNGVCSTVVEINKNDFAVEYSNHTLDTTNFKELKLKEFVNLERALLMSDRLSGHIVTGHVDGVVKLLHKEKDGFSNKLIFEMPKFYINQIIKKGSITINGISLTVAQNSSSDFVLEIIPHTYENTNLKYLKIGDTVNFETDIIGKYIEKILLSKDNKETSGMIDMDFLKEKGFC